MMAWRLVKQTFAADAFSGEGPRITGFRWNSRGTAVVYTAEHLSLAALESFIYLSETDKNMAFYAYRLDIPPDVQVLTLSLTSLPADWREPMYPQSTKKIGDAWVRAGASAILRVPSVVIPAEYNLILNPIHTDFHKIIIGAPENFSFDSRMWKQHN